MRVSLGGIPSIDISREYQTGEAPDVRTRPYLSIELIDATGTGNVASSESETVNVLAPAGYYYRLLNVFIKIPKPAGAGSGTHVTHLQNYAFIHSLKLGSLFGEKIEFDFLEILTADSEALPSNASVVPHAVKCLRADDTLSMQFIYYNFTNVTQANEREYLLLVEKIKI